MGNRIISLFFSVVLSISAEAGVVDVTILHTTDIHSHINLGVEETADQGDWLRLAARIRAEIANAGGRERCLLIDCGDTIQGTLAGVATRGEIGIEMLNSFAHDAWIMGNHELDFGVRRLVELIKLCRSPIINGNLQLADQPPLPAWRLYHKNGARIAVIGMNATFLEQWLWGDKMRGYRVSKSLEVIEEIMPDVMQSQPDLIIAACHQGYLERDRRGVSEIREIAFRFPQIDLILGGHSHRVFPGRKVSGAWYLQSGRHAERLGRAIVTVDTERQRVIEIRSHLLPTEGYEQDPECLDKVRSLRDAAMNFARREVCFIDQQVTSEGLPGRDCHLSEIICRAIAAATNVAVVLHGKLSEAAWAPQSMLTEAGLFEAIPYENGIGIASLTPAEIRRIIAEQWQYHGRRAFNGIFGIYVRLSRKSGKILDLTIPDSVISDVDGRIPVALNSYVIAGGGGRFPLLRQIVRQENAHLHDTGLVTRDVVREFMIASDEWKSPPVAWLHPE